MATQTPNKKNARRKSKSQADNYDIKEAKSAQLPAGKLGLILKRLANKSGATVDDLVNATGWQKHSVHGALSRLRTRGFAIRLETVNDRTAYRLIQAAG